MWMVYKAVWSCNNLFYNLSQRLTMHCQNWGRTMEIQLRLQFSFSYELTRSKKLFRKFNIVILFHHCRWSDVFQISQLRQCLRYTKLPATIQIPRMFCSWLFLNDFFLCHFSRQRARHGWLFSCCYKGGIVTSRSADSDESLISNRCLHFSKLGVKNDKSYFSGWGFPLSVTRK